MMIDCGVLIGTWSILASPRPTIEDRRGRFHSLSSLIEHIPNCNFAIMYRAKYSQYSPYNILRL